MYPRALGQSWTNPADCDPTLEDCSGTGGGGSSGSGLNWQQLISQGMTDVTQVVAPGTPSPVRLYTPSSTAAANVTSSPMLLLLGLAAVVLLAKGRH